MDIPSCEPPCRITNCKACYYDDVVRPLPDTCGNCSSYPTVEQAAAGCYKDWFTCIRRRDSVRNVSLNTKMVYVTDVQFLHSHVEM